ncbi:MAG: hypothetical protein R2799_05635 [Crocinitomicaceae bacterium]
MRLLTILFLFLFLFSCVEERPCPDFVADKIGFEIDKYQEKLSFINQEGAIRIFRRSDLHEKTDSKFIASPLNHTDCRNGFFIDYIDTLGISIQYDIYHTENKGYVFNLELQTLEHGIFFDSIPELTFKKDFSKRQLYFRSIEVKDGIVVSFEDENGVVWTQQKEGSE